MKAAKTQKKIERNTISTTKKAFKKKRKKYHTSKDKHPNFKNFFRMLKLTIQIYQMKNKRT